MKNKQGKNLVPLGDKIVVKVEEITKVGNILLPDSAKEKNKFGKVLAVGEGKLLEDGGRAPMEVNEGDEVWFNAYAGSEFEVDGEKVLVMGQGEVMCKTRS